MKEYLDNSATSWPKPPTLIEAISDYLTNYGASPGRSGHQMSLKAGREVFEARELISEFFNVPDSGQSIFTSNSTHGLNLALKGILKAGDHVVTTSLEHNSVMRPLRYLEKEIGIEITIIQCDAKGNINLEELENSIQKNTKLVATIHGSNVIGNVLPLAKIGKICKEKSVIFLVDAAQTAGYVPIDMQKDCIDILSFTGHKKLYGPSGIGGLCFKDKIEIAPLIHGGTGSNSNKDIQPDFYPDSLEAGTKNTVGIVGLKAGMQFVQKKGMQNIRKSVGGLCSYFIDQLKKNDRIIVYGPNSNEDRLPVVSINIKAMSSSDLAYILDKEFGIMIRVGLHCSPLAHKTNGTFPDGTARFSLGCFNTKQEIDYTIDAINQLISS